MTLFAVDLFKSAVVFPTLAFKQGVMAVDRFLLGRLLRDPSGGVSMRMAHASSFLCWYYHICDGLGVSPLFRDGDPGTVS